MAYEIAVVLGFVGISMISAYIAMNINRDKHGPIQIFFIFISLASWLGLLGSIEVILEIEGKTELSNIILASFTGVFYFIIFVLFYLSLVFIVNLKKLMENYKKRRKDGLYDPGGDMKL